jgi:hypothetical protein
VTDTQTPWTDPPRSPEQALAYILWAAEDAFGSVDQGAEHMQEALERIVVAANQTLQAGSTATRRPS